MNIQNHSRRHFIKTGLTLGTGAVMSTSLLYSPGTAPGIRILAANECSHKHFDSHYFKGESQMPIPTKTFETEIWFDKALGYIDDHTDEPFADTVVLLKYRAFYSIQDDPKWHFRQ